MTVPSPPSMSPSSLVTRLLRPSVSCLGLLLAGTAVALAQTAPAPAADQSPAPAVSAPAAPRRAPDVVFVPTPDSAVAAMLDMAAVTSKDVVYDLGCGDGRIVVAAARRGARAFGVDIDPVRIGEAKENAKRAGVTDRATFIEGDLFETDISRATVVTLYLLPSLNQKLIPKLRKELKPGTRIVSHAFDMGEWKPEAVREVDGRTLYLWRIP